MEGGATTTAVLSKVVTADMLSGVLSEITSLLPIVIPVMIGFIAIRKGIAFVQHILHAA
ncbi:unknown [Clostridium sp. CAG:780]|nr:unknown [Clostridium sp. CAG:780]